MKLYADNKQGALRCAVDSYQKSYIKELDLDTCKVFADPCVDGVWGIDSMKSGYRIVIFLGGYNNPWGKVRKFSDMEEGCIPLSNVKRYFERGDVTKRQLKNWVKKGNLTEEELEKIC